VTSGEKREGKIELCGDGQFVNQVFTAAMNLGGFVGEMSKSSIVENLARFLLRGAYKATILSAIENSQTQPSSVIGKDKLYLTLIGGGVFGNKYNWITDAIMEWKNLIINSGLQIYLVIYNTYSIDDESLTKFQCLVAETGGKLDNLT